MAGRSKSWLPFALAGLALAAMSPSTANAGVPPGLDVGVNCKVEGSAVVCLVSAKPAIQNHMTYARADVVQAPPFLKVLIGSVDYSESRDRKPKLALAFQAKKPGAGDIVVKVQGMVCADDGSSCPAVIKAVSAHVEVK